MVLRSTSYGTWHASCGIQRRKPHAELSRCSWRCWGRRGPAASARRAGTGIVHAPGPLCTWSCFAPTQPDITKASLRLHQGRGVNWSHITLLLTASAAGDQPRRHVQKEVMPLPNDRTARSHSPSHVTCVLVRQRSRARRPRLRESPRRPQAKRAVSTMLRGDSRLSLQLIPTISTYL